MADDDKLNLEPKNPYEAYSAQGFELLKRREYERAIGLFTKALVAEPQNVYCLLSRSLCYLKCGFFDEALEDVGKVLKADSKNPKALLLQAEIFYEKGDFENSLMIFHRGKARRPEIKQFSRGINKTSLAISNSCAGREIPGDLTGIDFTEFFQRVQSKEEKKKSSGVETDKAKKPVKKVLFKRKKVEELPVMPAITKDSATCRRLMRELHNDRKYLSVTFDTENGRVGMWQSTKTHLPALSKSKITNSRTIQKHTVKGASYLDRRLNFWFQQEPRGLPKVEKSATASKSEVSPGNREFNEILKKKRLNLIEAAISKAYHLLRAVPSMFPNDHEAGDKLKVKCYFIMGDLYRNLGKLDLAHLIYQKALKISTFYEWTKSIDKGTDKLAETYTEMRNFSLAIKTILMMTMKLSERMIELLDYAVNKRATLEVDSPYFPTEF